MAAAESAAQEGDGAEAERGGGGAHGLISIPIFTSSAKDTSCESSPDESAARLRWPVAGGAHQLRYHVEEKPVQARQPEHPRHAPREARHPRLAAGKQHRGEMSGDEAAAPPLSGSAAGAGARVVLDLLVPLYSHRVVHAQHRVAHPIVDRRLHLAPHELPPAEDRDGAADSGAERSPPL